MEYRKLEKSNQEVSVLGFGCMRFPVTEDGKIDRPEAQKMLDKAMAAGVTYYDTAYPYHSGESELFVGEAMKKYDRSSFYLATKLPVWQVESLEDAKRLFEEQLERLQTEYIDFYLLHAMNEERWAKMQELGVVDYFEKEKAAGRIRNYGFSFHDTYEVYEEILTARDWDFSQIQFNYLDTEEQAGLKGVRLSEKLAIPLVIMEPVKGGSLAKVPAAAQKLMNEVNDRSAAAWALRYVAKFDSTKVILSGMTTMEQLEDNLATFDKPEAFSEEEQRVIDAVTDIFRTGVRNGCTGCNYCMPCPAGVDIPKCFKAWNKYGVFGDAELGRHDYFEWIQESERADQCVECGMCEEQCPQKLEIREDLKRVHEEMGTL